MEQIVPWSQLCDVIKPHYPKSGKGRPPIGLERMLRMYFVQHWFKLADKACEEALLDSTALRRFVGIDLGREWVPDATTLLKIRRFAGAPRIGHGVVHAGQPDTSSSRYEGRHRDHRGCHHHRRAELDEERRQGAQPGYAPDPQRPAVVLRHEDVDSRTALVHSAAVTAANVHDKHLLEDLLHGDERRIYGDSAYDCQKQLIREHAPHSKDFTNQCTRKRGEIDDAERSRKRNKSRIRARVEHVFAVVKPLWSFGKMRYRGLDKNAYRSFVALGLANLNLARSRLDA